MRVIRDEDRLQGLQLSVSAAKAELIERELQLQDFLTSLPQNEFTDLDFALRFIEDTLCLRARDDCEGSHCFGLDEYVQDFIVDDVIYSGTLKCEYSRHDKTYYYVESHVFSHEVKFP